ncbi:hypothetical protein ACFVUS_25395 [Nocardia sp. NPDC058058]|uniref:hypothetical protein n=1 Tax=Nocardia sp. NPDC058058 TaxID=3346317 RepID=UPI0036D7CC16
MGGELDAAWRAVRDVLGTMARDLTDAASTMPTRTADVIAGGVRGRVEADAASTIAVADASSALRGEVAADAVSPRYVRGRDLIDEADYSALRRSGGIDSLGTSPTFERIQRLQGFDGRVTRATSDEIDSAVARGGAELFRGFEEGRFLDAFVSGPVRPGGGTTGSGTYASPLERIALHYTDPGRTQDLATRQAKVLRMALRPDARTITLNALESDRGRTLVQISRELTAIRNIRNPTAAESARYTALLDQELVMADIGQYGALRGWDAIDGSATWRNKEWAVLNPTALLAQR